MTPPVLSVLNTVELAATKDVLLQLEPRPFRGR